MKHLKSTAKNQVESPLHEERKSESMENMLKQLREQAKIEYVLPGGLAISGCG